MNFSRQRVAASGFERFCEHTTYNSRNNHKGHFMARKMIGLEICLAGESMASVSLYSTTCDHSAQFDDKKHN
eukprot:scaffold171630_cov27-Prasinocladus_malaysianus.AAC.2